MGNIRPNSAFATVQNAFVMLHDWVDRNYQIADKDNKTVLNLSFYVTEPLDLGMGVEWYKPEKVRKNKPSSDLIKQLIRTGSEHNCFFTAEVVNLENGVGLSVFIKDMDLWGGLESNHFFFSEMLRQIANNGQKSALWIHYNVIKLNLSTEHTDAQRDFYKQLSNTL